MRAKKRGTAKPKTPRLTTPQRELALEAAIIDAPDDPLPRLVYGDWLQAKGEGRGEWIALSAASEAERANVRLRAAAVAFLDKHRGELLGAGAALLPGAWIGWRGGFIDELRLQPFPNQRTVARNLAALLAHPSCRFVRHLALGALPRMQAVLDAVADAAPPLLETLVVLDHPDYEGATCSVDRVAALPTLRRLALKRVECTVALPELRELYVAFVSNEVVPAAYPKLVELTLDTRDAAIAPQTLREVVRALPELRRLRLLNASNADALIAALSPLAGQFELLDIAHSAVSHVGVSQLLAWPREMQLLALRTGITAAMTGRLREHFRAVAVSRPAGPPIDRLGEDETEDDMSWLSYRVTTEGRDAVRAVPGAGAWLYSLGINHNIGARASRAVPLLDAALTMPAPGLETLAWANAAITHERLRQFDDAELIAREGLLRAPREPNLFAIIIDALRRSGRLPEALAMLPRAYTALTSADRGPGEAEACLLDCLFTLAQAERHAEVLGLAVEHVLLMTPDAHAVVAMSQVALGFHKDAGSTMELANAAEHPVIHHAAAVMCLIGRRWSAREALAALRRLRAANYPEWHWIASDRNLAPLHSEPEFVALLDEPGDRPPRGAVAV
ncbi:MAG: TIGR02996 domain-containing protein [Deltaproteobacteria bacterium]|nr:TIGR02996 domain-containing protein [Deltaproteobacteria bacterium]